MQYLFPFSQANTIHKFGVDISLYGTQTPDGGLVYEETENGHLEEFYDDVSTYRWFIIEGSGTFVIDDEKIEVKPKDLVVVPPKKRIHYFGNMKMVLCVTPAYSQQNDHHVRDVDIAESPYFTKEQNSHNAE